MRKFPPPPPPPTAPLSAMAALPSVAADMADVPRSHRDLLPFVRNACRSRARATMWCETSDNDSAGTVWCFGFGTLGTGDARPRAILYARRRKRCTTPHWVISTDRDDVWAESAASRSYDCYLGKLRGTDRTLREFTLYGHGDRSSRRALAVVVFAPCNDDAVDDVDADDGVLPRRERTDGLRPGEVIVASGVGLRGGGPLRKLAQLRQLKEQRLERGAARGAARWAVSGAMAAALPAPDLEAFDLQRNFKRALAMGAQNVLMAQEMLCLASAARKRHGSGCDGDGGGDGGWIDGASERRAAGSAANVRLCVANPLDGAIALPHGTRESRGLAEDGDGRRAGATQRSAARRTLPATFDFVRIEARSPRWRCGGDAYAVRFRWPLSPFQAFGLALAALSRAPRE